jgi:hypothetical protein
MDQPRPGQDPTLQTPAQPDGGGIDPRIEDGNYFNQNPNRFTRRQKVVGGVLGACAAVGGLVVLANTSDGERSADDTAAEELANADEACGETFAIKEFQPNAEYRWFPDGVQAIAEAETDAEARDAAYDWVDAVKRYPHFLAAAAEALTDEENVDPDSLHADGCINEAGLKLVSKVELALGESEIRKTEAPAEGAHNTGANDDGEVTRSKHSGLSGNRSALEITRETPKGTCTVYVLERCGQIYTFEVCLPSAPEGPTDEDQPSPTTTVIPGTSTSIPNRSTTTTPGRATTTTIHGMHPPAAGPPPEASQLPHTDTATPTPGHVPGNPESVGEQQDRDRDAIDSGSRGELDDTGKGVEETDGDARDVGGAGENTGGSKGGTVGVPDRDNPQYQPGTKTGGTNEGVSDGHDSPETDTEYDDQTSDPSKNPGGF